MNKLLLIVVLLLAFAAAALADDVPVELKNLAREIENKMNELANTTTTTTTLPSPPPAPAPSASPPTSVQPAAAGPYPAFNNVIKKIWPMPEEMKTISPKLSPAKFMEAPTASSSYQIFYYRKSTLKNLGSQDYDINYMINLEVTEPYRMETADKVLERARQRDDDTLETYEKTWKWKLKPGRSVHGPITLAGADAAYRATWLEGRPYPQLVLYDDLTFRCGNILVSLRGQQWLVKKLDKMPYIDQIAELIIGKIKALGGSDIYVPATTTTYGPPPTMPSGPTPAY